MIKYHFQPLIYKIKIENERALAYSEVILTINFFDHISPCETIAKTKFTYSKVLM